MRDQALQNSKIKRILLYWDYLGKLRIEPQASIEFVSYVFAIREQWILRIIRNRRLDEPALQSIDLPHIELEMDLIDAYAKKLLRSGKQNRPGQTKLF